MRSNVTGRLSAWERPLQPSCHLRKLPSASVRSTVCAQSSAPGRTAAAATVSSVTPANSWTVGDMLTSLNNAVRYDPQAAALWDEHEAATAVGLARQTLMSLGYNMPLQSNVRDSFCEEGGLEVVLRLLHHPDLQYLAISALLSLLGTWTRSTAVTSAADCAAQSAAQSDIAQALLPLLAPGNSWVIQGRCCGMLTLLIRHELRTHDQARQDGLREGVRWQLLDGGGVSSLTSLLHSTSQEAQHQASTTLSMLTRFQGRYHAALLGESTVLSSLVEFAAIQPAHSPLVDVSVAVVNLCNTDSPALQQQVIAAGGIQALMQMQSLEFTGPCQGAARKCLAALAAGHPAARRQILDTAAVRHPAGTRPAEWSAWWQQLRMDVGLA